MRFFAIFSFLMATAAAFAEQPQRICVETLGGFIRPLVFQPHVRKRLAQLELDEKVAEQLIRSSPLEPLHDNAQGSRYWIVVRGPGGTYYHFIFTDNPSHSTMRVIFAQAAGSPEITSFFKRSALKGTQGRIQVSPRAYERVQDLGPLAVTAWEQLKTISIDDPETQLHTGSTERAQLTLKLTENTKLTANFIERKQNQLIWDVSVAKPIVVQSDVFESISQVIIPETLENQISLPTSLLKEVVLTLSNTPLKAIQVDESGRYIGLSSLGSDLYWILFKVTDQIATVQSLQKASAKDFASALAQTYLRLPSTKPAQITLSVFQKFQQGSLTWQEVSEALQNLEAPPVSTKVTEQVISRAVGYTVSGKRFVFFLVGDTEYSWTINRISTEAPRGNEALKYDRTILRIERGLYSGLHLKVAPDLLARISHNRLSLRQLHMAFAHTQLPAKIRGDLFTLIVPFQNRYIRFMWTISGGTPQLITAETCSPTAFQNFANESRQL